MKRIAIIGGDGRKQIGPGLGTGVRVEFFRSSGQGGNGDIRSARAAIASGSIDLVIFLIRWLGHSDVHTLVDACKAAGVPFRRAIGGLSSAKRSIQQFLEREALAARQSPPRTDPERPDPRPDHSYRRSPWARSSGR